MNPLLLAMPLAIAVFLMLNLYCKNNKAPKANRIIISCTGAIAAFIVVIGVFDSENKANSETVADVTLVPESKTVKRETKPARQTLPVSEWKKLYQELEAFKTDSVFLEYGFGGGGQLLQRQWLEKVNSHYLPMDVPPSHHATPSNLRQLAMAYIRKDTAQISQLKKELNKVFNRGE